MSRWKWIKVKLRVTAQPLSKDEPAATLSTAVLPVENSINDEEKERARPIHTQYEISDGMREKMSSLSCQESTPSAKDDKQGNSMDSEISQCEVHRQREKSNDDVEAVNKSELVRSASHEDACGHSDFKLAHRSPVPMRDQTVNQDTNAYIYYVFATALQMLLSLGCNASANEAARLLLALTRLFMTIVETIIGMMILSLRVISVALPKRIGAHSTSFEDAFGNRKRLDPGIVADWESLPQRP